MKYAGAPALTLELAKSYGLKGFGVNWFDQILEPSEKICPLGNHNNLNLDTISVQHHVVSLDIWDPKLATAQNWPGEANIWAGHSWELRPMRP